MREIGQRAPTVKLLAKTLAKRFLGGEPVGQAVDVVENILRRQIDAHIGTSVAATGKCARVLTVWNQFRAAFNACDNQSDAELCARKWIFRALNPGVEPPAGV